MRASLIVRQLCAALASHVHQARRVVMFAAVDALVRGGRLSLTALGRSMSPTALPKHRIKRIDRFLGNSHAQNEVLAWYTALARRLLGKNRRPVVLIDWTQTFGDYYALVAAVAFVGRAIPIYAEVHPKARYTNRRVHRDFLHSLAKIFASDTKPIIVADAGFKTPFFDEIYKLNWDFVIRLRGRGVLKGWSTRWRVPDPRLRFVDAHSMANEKAQALGQWRYAADGYTDYRIVLGPRTTRAPRKSDPYYERRSLEPWLLATTLNDAPHIVVGVYALRMQIEESFRDAKNARMGWALEHARSRDVGRQNLLFLIASLALAAALLTGSAVETTGQAKRFQANTICSRRVQSLYHLGAFALLEELLLCSIRRVITERCRIFRLRPASFQLCLPFTRHRRGKWY